MEKTTPDDALRKLIDGNSRFANDRHIHPNSDAARRLDLLDGQSPFATIITCSDSRVPPEIIFDCGIGDLFVVRVAGNIIDSSILLGSVLYATEHLSCPLVVVLGHESCGAVTAAIQPENKTSKEPAAIRKIISRIRKNISRTLLKSNEGQIDADDASKENMESVCEMLRKNSEIALRISGGSLIVTSAYYSFKTGKITWK